MNMALKIHGGEPDELAEFRNDVLEGLRREQKTLPCKYLYDETGSRLFEEICELRDYYVTRTEAQIFSEHLQDMASQIGPEALIIEPGAGNCEKVRPLLAALERPAAYIPIDISPEILLKAKATIKQSMPRLLVEEAIGDFTGNDVWQVLPAQDERKRVLFFPGSTIGNFDPIQARALLQGFASHLKAGDALLIGTDLDKDPVVLERAYHDSEHVTAAFNKNLLVRINNELQGNFDPELFAHRAFYHPLRQRVEMHLVSLKDQCVSIAGKKISFREGETIHTENSHKYTIAGFHKLLAETGFRAIEHWTDQDQHYAIHYAQID